MGKSWGDVQKELKTFLADNQKKRAEIGEQYAKWVKLQAEVPGLTAEQKAIQTHVHELAAKASHLKELYAAGAANLAAEAAQSNKLKIINIELAFFYFWRCLWDLTSAVAQFFPAYKLLVTVTDSASEIGGAASEAHSEGAKGTQAVDAAKAALDGWKELKEIKGAVAAGLDAANAIMDIASHTKKTVDDWKKSGPAVVALVKTLVKVSRAAIKIIPVLIKDPKVRKAVDETLKKGAGKGIDPVLATLEKVISAIENTAQGFEAASAGMESAANEAITAKLSTAQLTGVGKIALPKDLAKKSSKEDLASLSTINSVKDAEQFVDVLVHRMVDARNVVQKRAGELDKLVDDMQKNVAKLPLLKDLQEWKTKVPDKAPELKDFAKERLAALTRIDQEIAIVEQLRRDIPKSARQGK